jgi:hypothetical protein
MGAGRLKEATVIEWIDWWYQSEAFGRTFVGTLVGGILLSWLGNMVDEEAYSEWGGAVGVGMMIAGAVSLFVCFLALVAPAFLRLVIWVGTGA